MPGLKYLKINKRWNQTVRASRVDGDQVATFESTLNITHSSAEIS